MGFPIGRPVLTSSRENGVGLAVGHPDRPFTDSYVDRKLADAHIGLLSLASRSRIARPRRA
jgi:hypothetical protein